MLVNDKKIVTIFRGDDTGGQLGKSIVINFHCDESVEMTGVTVRFELGGFYSKEFTDVKDGDQLDIFLSHSDTARLPLGICFGKIIGIDSSGKIRTFNNRIPFKVTNKLCEAYAEEDSFDVSVSNTVSWDGISNKPTEFPPSPHTHQISDVDGLEDALPTDEQKQAWNSKLSASDLKTINDQSIVGTGNITIYTLIPTEDPDVYELAMPADYNPVVPDQPGTDEPEDPVPENPDDTGDPTPTVLGSVTMRESAPVIEFSSDEDEGLVCYYEDSDGNKLAEYLPVGITD